MIHARIAARVCRDRHLRAFVAKIDAIGMRLFSDLTIVRFEYIYHMTV